MPGAVSPAVSRLEGTSPPPLSLSAPAPGPHHPGAASRAERQMVKIDRAAPPTQKQEPTGVGPPGPRRAAQRGRAGGAGSSLGARLASATPYRPRCQEGSVHRPGNLADPVPRRQVAWGPQQASAPVARGRLGPSSRQSPGSALPAGAPVAVTSLIPPAGARRPEQLWLGGGLGHHYDHPLALHLLQLLHGDHRRRPGLGPGVPGLQALLQLPALELQLVQLQVLQLQLLLLQLQLVKLVGVVLGHLLD
mmetsp:Transcript_18349/g.44191  ORF Transcript_18349/g.44191 Transcript_18349/m.44191 type:complete len:249 (+) Transcript_18349:83-829(+)